MLGLSVSKEADGPADVLIDGVSDLTALMSGSPTRDQIKEPKSSCHGPLGLATELPI